MRRLLRVCADVKRDNVMNEHEMIWRILGLVTRDHEASTLLAKAVLKWVRENKKALHLDTEPGAKRLSWRGLSARSVRRQDMERNGAPELLALAGMAPTACRWSPVLRTCCVTRRQTCSPCLVRFRVPSRARQLGA